jgi:hypothetical protein
MASTFSPNLRIELIGDGEQAGTWGTTTNTNLGTLVEDAISGYVAVTISSANQALTAVNGAADQARNAIIQLNSASAAFAVYAPPESKQYTIFNNTSYTGTIYNSSALGNTTAAGTGVAIPAGKTMTVWSDGANFATQNTRTTGDFVGTVTADSSSTAVTQVSGTNNTTLATTAFVQEARTATLEAVYPVGSIYINATNATNPGTLLGFGTWAAFGAGRVPVGFDAADPLFDAAEETGGSKDAVVVSHTHAVTDPGHFHSLTASTGSGIGTGATSVAFTTSVNTSTQTTGISIASAGVSGTNANLQPYITVYMWKRTA